MAQSVPSDRRPLQATRFNWQSETTTLNAAVILVHTKRAFFITIYCAAHTLVTSARLMRIILVWNTRHCVAGAQGPQQNHTDAPQLFEGRQFVMEASRTWLPGTHGRTRKTWQYRASQAADGRGEPGRLIPVRSSLEVADVFRAAHADHLNLQPPQPAPSQPRSGLAGHRHAQPGQEHVDHELGMGAHHLFAERVDAIA